MSMIEGGTLRVNEMRRCDLFRHGGWRSWTLKIMHLLGYFPYASSLCSRALHVLASILILSTLYMLIVTW